MPLTISKKVRIIVTILLALCYMLTSLHLVSFKYVNVQLNDSNAWDTVATAAKYYDLIVRNETKIEIKKASSYHLSNTATTQSSKSLMVIATYPNSNMKYSAIWSQLECYAGNFDKIIVSAPTIFKENMTQFVKDVEDKMPAIGAKIQTQFYINNRYDTGLWCDALIYERYIKPNANNTFVGGESEYDNFMLINDSLLAVEQSNIFLETLQSRNANLVSLNYWGNKDDWGKNKEEVGYWLESPLRVFSREGIETFADQICLLPPIKWRKHCPQFILDSLRGSLRKLQKDKRCIVELTEINVVDHYDREKVHGLFPGNDPSNTHWVGNFSYWANHLRDELSFPAAKVSHGMFEYVQRERPKDMERCTTKLSTKWKVPLKLDEVPNYM